MFRRLIFVGKVCNDSDTCSRSAAGYSLVETLAALVLTGLLFAAALPLFVGFVRHWAAGTAITMRADDWMSATARLSDDFAQAMPIGENGESGNAGGLSSGNAASSGSTTAAGSKSGNAAGFRGSGEQVEFVRPSLGARGPSALDMVELTIVRRGNVIELVRGTRSFSSAHAGNAAGDFQRVTLLRVGSPLQFTYLDAKGMAHESWGRDSGLPAAVALQVGSPDAVSLGLSSLTFPVVGGLP